VTLNGQVERAVAEVAPWVERLSRLGYYSKGVVYAIVASIALGAAFGMTSAEPDSDSAFRAILSQPFGQILLMIVATGLFGYTAWRFAQAAIDPEHRDSSVAKRAAFRVYSFGSGIVHGGLGVQALRLALGAPGQSNGGPEQASGLMASTWGVWVVGIAGAIAIGVGLYQIYRAWEADLGSQFRLSHVSAEWRIWVLRLSRFGIAARGVVFLTIGWFVLQAARLHDPNEVRGLGGALRGLEQTPWGPALVVVIALGLIAHGVYTFLKGRYRRIRV
jgi:hypothetical protein